MSCELTEVMQLRFTYTYAHTLYMHMHMCAIACVHIIYIGSRSHMSHHHFHRRLYTASLLQRNVNKPLCMGLISVLALTVKLRG